MRKFLLSFLFFIISFFIFLQKGNAQNNLIITSQLPAAGLTMCGTQKDFKVILSNATLSAISGRTLSLSFSDNSIYFLNVLSSNAGVIVSPSSGTGTRVLTVNINSLPSRAKDTLLTS